MRHRVRLLPVAPYLDSDPWLRGRRILPKWHALGVLTACTLMAGAGTARAQEIEPRAYSNAPVGVNFLIAGYAYTEGGLAFDPALPVDNPQLKTSSAVIAYARVLDFWGKSGKVDAIVPFTWLSGSADLADQTIQREVDGLADAKFDCRSTFTERPRSR